MTMDFTYWEQEGDYLGYLNEFPDYWTQGTSLEGLKDHLIDLYKDLSSGEIEGVRRVGHLELA